MDNRKLVREFLDNQLTAAQSSPVVIAPRQRKAPVGEEGGNVQEPSKSRRGRPREYQGQRFQLTTYIDKNVKIRMDYLQKQQKKPLVQLINEAISDLLEKYDC